MTQASTSQPLPVRCKSVILVFGCMCACVLGGQIEENNFFWQLIILEESFSSNSQRLILSVFWHEAKAAWRVFTDQQSGFYGLCDLPTWDKAIKQMSCIKLYRRGLHDENNKEESGDDLNNIFTSLRTQKAFDLNYFSKQCCFISGLDSAVWDSARVNINKEM